MNFPKNSLKINRPLNSALLLNISIFMSFSVAAQGVFEQDIFPILPVEDTCQFLMPEGVYSYHQLYAGMLKSNTAIALPSQSQTWQVTCTAPAAGVRISVASDSQAEIVFGKDLTHFSLGKVNGLGELGYYQVTLDQGKVDGRYALLYYTTHSTTVGEAYSDLLLHSSEFHGFTVDGKSPATGQLFSIRMTVSPTLNSLKNMNGPLVEGADIQSDLPLVLSFGL